MEKKPVKKKVVLRILNGNIREGCMTIELQIYQGEKRVECYTATLPPNQELYDSLQISLTSSPMELTRSSELPNPSERTIVIPEEVESNPNPDLTNMLNDWLRSTEFKNIRYELLYHIRGCCTLTIESNQTDIKRLPWKSWDLLCKYCPTIVVPHS
jgi:hypothetical protein